MLIKAILWIAVLLVSLSLLSHGGNAEAGTVDRIVAIQPNDIGIQFPDEIPKYKKVIWSEPLSGFYETKVDVLFHGILVDRIQILRVDPPAYYLCNSFHVFGLLLRR